MKLATRRFFTSRRLWARLIVPAMLSVAYAAAVLSRQPKMPHPAPPFWPRSPGDPGIRNGNARGPVGVSAAAQPARPRTIQATAVPSRGGGGVLTRLSLVKVVRNGDGGTASEGDWTLHADGASTEAPTNPCTSPVNSPIDFMADVYTLSETYNGSDPRVAASYTASAWQCVNNATAAPVGVTPDSTVVIDYGDAVTCTITNSYITNSDTKPVPVARVRITGKKLYVAWESPYKGGLVGLSGWVITVNPGRRRNNRTHHHDQCPWGVRVLAGEHRRYGVPRRYHRGLRGRARRLDWPDATVRKGHDPESTSAGLHRPGRGLHECPGAFMDR